MSGNLQVQPICANLSRDTESLGSMDPYVVVALDSEKKKTKV